MAIHKVREGECLVSIAERYGYLWSSLWLHGGNKVLRDLRKDPNVLLAGDLVELPPVGTKIVEVSSDGRHKFQRKGIPAKLRLQLKIGGVVLNDQDYRLNIGDTCIDGTTDSDGMVEADLPVGARSGDIRIGGPDGFVLPLKFGEVDPLQEPSGITKRLHNLGFYGADDDEGLKDALERFQFEYGLEKTGAVDAATKSRLAEEFGQ